MRKKTFSEEQIALALRKAEAGTPVTDVCRKLGVSKRSFHNFLQVDAPVARPADVLGNLPGGRIYGASADRWGTWAEARSPRRTHSPSST
jgi:hypothetical protein